MKRANLISCLVLSIFLISPVTTWAASCPEGQKMNDRKGECIKDQTTSSKNKTLNNAFDGEYAVDIRCSWGSINTMNMNWKIVDGKLNFDDYRWRVKGEVVGNNLSIKGTRRSKSGDWTRLAFRGAFSNNIFPLKGIWQGSKCKGTFTKKENIQIAQSDNSDVPNRKTFTIKGSKDYLSIADVINDRPVNNNHKQPDLKLVLQHPKIKTGASSLTYPLVVLIPSSQGLELMDEVKTARDFRKLGYATLLVYSFKARQVGGDAAEIGVSINSPTVAVDAMLALKEMGKVKSIDSNRTALYGASKGSLSVEETMIDAISTHRQLPTFKVLLSENSNMCFDWSKMPLNKNIKLVVFTGGDDDSGTLSECLERTAIFKEKGYDIEHINYEGAAHRFILDHKSRKRTDGIGYSKCEWLFNSDGEQGYRVKSTGVTTFPKNRQEIKKTITKCLNRGIEYGGTKEFRKRFFDDAHRIMQAVFQE